MKLSILTSAVFAGVCTLNALAGHLPAAAGSPVGQVAIAPLAREIAGNAEAAGRNAEIYQWARVNRETDRVVAAERRLESLMAGSTSPTMQSLQTSVRELREARLAHDAKRAAAAAKQVSAACQSLE